MSRKESPAPGIVRWTFPKDSVTLNEDGSVSVEAAMARATLTETLDPDTLGRAFHEVASHGGPLTPCGYVSYPDGEYIKVGYNENPPEDGYACLCQSIALGILEAIRSPESDR